MERAHWTLGRASFDEGKTTVYVLELKAAPENRLSPAVLVGLSDVVDYLERASQRSDEPIGLLLTGSGRFFCNGFDLHALAALASDAERQQFTRDFAALLARFLALPYVTVAAVNGHAFGGGLVLAAACDALVANAGRGWLCMPAVQLGITLPRGLLQVLRRRVADAALTTVVLQAERMTASRAVELGVADAAVPADRLLHVAAELATKTLRLDRDALAHTKRTLAADAIQSLLQADMLTRGLPARL